MSAKPWLSVVMPTYNGAEFLHAALESLESEASDDVEIVVADDGSTDGTIDVLRAHQSRLQLRVVQRKRVGNWVAGTNVALREATGSYACFLHQDDIWIQGRLASLRKALAGGDAALVVHSAIFIDRFGRPLGRWSCPFRGRDEVISSPDFVERLLVQNFLAIAAPVFDRAAALRAGPLDEALWYTADWDFWLRLGQLGPVRYVPTPLVGFRVHPASQTMARNRTRSDFEEQLTTVLRRHLPTWSSTAPPSRARSVQRAAEFSVRVNAALAGVVRGESAEWGSLARALVGLGPGGFLRYLRDSRIWERVRARQRAR